MKLDGKLKPPTADGLADVIWTTINNYIAEHTAVLPDDKVYNLAAITRQAVATVYHGIRKD